MAYSIGNPGEGAITKAALMFAFGVIFVTFLLGIMLSFLMRASSCIGLLLMIVVMAVEMWFFRSSVAEVMSSFSEGGKWAKGAKGEWKTYSALKELPGEFVFFNDFHPATADGHAKWNVDHIVIGPSGIFVVETKNYASALVAPADRNHYSKKNVRQADRNACELKTKLVKWSAGALGDVFVVPIVVYVQDGARVDRLREGNVRVLPLRLLTQTIATHKEHALDSDRILRVAQVLYNQMPVGQRAAFQPEFEEHARKMRAHVKAEKARRLSARQEAAQAGAEVASAAAGATPLAPVAEGTIAAAAEISTPVPQPPVCPQCGGILRARKASRGQFAGVPFLGCSNLPKCRYIQRLPAS